MASEDSSSRARGSEAGDSQFVASSAGTSEAGDSQAGNGDSQGQAGSSKSAGRSGRREFRPMDAVLNGRPLTAEEKEARKARGFSENYLGNYKNVHNKPADIPDEENCSLYITGLPIDVTVKDILDDIRDIGKVFSLHISPRRDCHSHAAAAITFFTRKAAERFLRRFETKDTPSIRWGGAVANPGRILGRLPVNIVWNQIKAAPFAEPENVTRVIQVEGPSDIVNEEFLLSFFRSKCRFDLESTEVLWEGYRNVAATGGHLPPLPSSVQTPTRRTGRAKASMNWRERAQPVSEDPEPEVKAAVAAPLERKHYRIMEFRFGTVRGQALACKMALDCEHMDKGVLVRYGLDPCGP
ncbi:hypothetical protein B0T20DRAFT_496580 [Sordaria brevicollis]|uniref:RRM domain-containing protein n=1 Tax=Sordaria brevicollis TaxID=83679 RepID=A0AAE0UDI4_SORBR|nr:hypothetical protein B0T20DRAFT_496580 [Sordaria brevicollis]